MRERMFTIRRTERFDAPVDALWNAVADTERLNIVAGTGFAPYVAEDVIGSDGRTLRRCSKRMGPFVLRWEERFGQWVDRRFVEMERFFFNGPYKELSVRISFSGEGTDAQVDFDYTARWDNLLGEALFRLGFLHLITRELPAATHKLMLEPLKVDAIAERRAAAAKATAEAPPERLATIKQHLEDQQAHTHGLTSRLMKYLDSSDPIEVRRMRPLALAKAWGARPSDVVDLMLAAHRAGLLALRWEVMCPRCRGGKSQSLLLSNVPREVHCTSCNIDYERDFARNVELVFAPSPWYQVPATEAFCIQSAVATSHVKIQCDVGALGERTEQVILRNGRYRIRTIEPGPMTEIEIFGGVIPEIVFEEDRLILGDPAPQGFVHAINKCENPRCLVIETTEWSRNALSVPTVIGMRAFRELCPEQLLRPGDEVEIGWTGILFTDLKGSTALFEQVGDSRAYAMVRNHFAFLEERIARHDGALVKTIGDAVMATFPSGEAALCAALDMQDEVGIFNRNHDLAPIELKIGVHEGTCVAVTSNGVLDYFGAAVNLAARLQAQADGGEIVLSMAISASGEAPAHLAARSATEDRALLGGFAEPVRFVRVKGTGAADSSDARG